MNSPAFIELTSYGRPVRLSVTSGITLPTRVIKAAQAEPSPRVHASLEDIRSTTEVLKELLVARQRRLNLRPIDHEFDGSWAGLFGRVHAHTRVRTSPHRERAGELLTELFPGGLAWLKEGFEAEWIHAKTLLERIDQDGHAEELELIAGEGFLQWARDASAKLGEALGLGKSEPPRAPGLAPALTAIAHAIANYGRILAGEVDLDDPASLEAFRLAVAPIDEHRRSQRAGKGAALDEAEELEADALEQEAEALGPDELAELELPPVPEPLEG